MQISIFSFPLFNCNLKNQMMISSSKNLFQLFLVFVVLLCDSYASEADHAIGGAPQIKCKENERQALLNFKHHLTDMKGLSSWGSKENQKDCCEWQRVNCDNRTGNVIGIDLHDSSLEGEISHSLLELKHLKYLDLSFNFFYDGNIPVFFGSLTSLKYLNLSQSEFSGTIPQELRNLSSLQTLDLSWNFLFMDNLEWLLPLQSLRDLHLSEVQLTNATDWLKSVSNLPLLQVLDLYDCNLPPAPPSSANSMNSSTALVVIDLSWNYNVDSSIFTWLFNSSDSLTEIELPQNSLQGPVLDDFAKMVSLKHLDLSSNKIQVSIPSNFSNYRSLGYLDLGNNSISGPLPKTIAQLSSLKYLNLRSNKLNGSIPEANCQLPNLEVLNFGNNEFSGVVPDFLLPSSLRGLHLEDNHFSGALTQRIGYLSNLEKLYLRSNNFEGVISESLLSNFSRLQDLDLSFNTRLEFRFWSDWIPSFQLDFLSLRNCTVGPHVPKWLQTQKNIAEIDLSATGISGEIPSWFANQMSQLHALNLSHNFLGGNLPDLNRIANNLWFLDLSSNRFEGPVPQLLNYTMLFHLDLSGNSLSGNISFLCKSSSIWLEYVDLSDNQLSGDFPDCWGHIASLKYLNLANNRLSGKFSLSMGQLTMIRTLKLRNNSFTGVLPRSWKYLDQLSFIDLGHNRLSGTIPLWIGSNVRDVVVLDFSSNNFSGNIPKSICGLSKIQVLDLSGNTITGKIPKCINNFTALTQKWSSIEHIGGESTLGNPIQETSYVVFDRCYNPEALLMWKGIESKYKSILALVKLIDLSSNNLTGDIPLGITKLVGLIGLNLSRNHLTGTIPLQIGNLQSLDVLDLSNNQLSGEIPPSLAQLGQLGMLNLSNNNFTGRIPPNKHEASAFEGNPGLCSKPLEQPCPGPPSPPFNQDEEEEEDKIITKGFYLSKALGFVFGFWGVCGFLFFNRSCRHCFFGALKEMGDWAYVTIALKLAKLHKRFSE